MKRFEIYYTNGVIISGETTSDWNMAPSAGVQNVVVLHDDDSAQERIYGVDFYVLMADNQIVGSDILLPGSVKFGEQIAFVDFELIRDSAFHRSKIWDRQPNTKWIVGVRELGS